MIVPLNAARSYRLLFGSTPMAERTNFDLYRGSAPTLRFRLTLPEDVTGWTTSFVIKEHAADANVVLTVAGAISANAVGANTSGIFDVLLTAAQTANLTSGFYAYSFGRTDTGNEDILTLGTVTVRDV